MEKRRQDLRAYVCCNATVSWRETTTVQCEATIDWSILVNAQNVFRERPVKNAQNKLGARTDARQRA